MKFKRVLSLLLAAALCFLCGSAALAYERQKEHTPVILIPGYSSSPLFLNYGTAEEEQVWGLDTDKVVAAVLDNLAELGIGLGALPLGNIDRLSRVLGREALKIIDYLAINPDGSSKYALAPGFPTAETSNNRWILDNKDGVFVGEKQIMGGVAEIIGEENVFNFFSDFRRDVVSNAKSLRAYIKDVKKYTGSKKVSILTVSQGGQVAGAYLSMYGTLGDLDSVVMTYPALGGAALAYDALSGAVKIDKELLINYIQCGLVAERNFEWLMRALELDFLDRLLNKILQEYFAPVALYWGSVWDFIPTEHYEEMKARWLDPVEHAWLIKSSDYMHYTIMPGYGKAFKAARKAGVNLSIITGTGAKAVSGMDVNSDTIIPTASATGALCAPYGERFADGYAGTGKACKKKAHHHVSPSLEIDATHCWLPENTWFIEGQFHSMSYKDPYSRLLVRKLLLTRDIADVHSDPQYPQFGLTNNPQDELYIEFDQSPQGFVTPGDKALRIRNLSEKYPVRIISISCGDLGIKFNPRSLGRIAPGGTAEIKFTGAIPEAHIKGAGITVNYLQLGSLSVFGSKTFRCTILGGK